MTEKSTTCFGKETGKPVTVYRSESEARSGAEHVRLAYGNEMVTYRCDRCDLWHLAPADRQTESARDGCSCRARNGQPKTLYFSEDAAERRAEILREEEGVYLKVYGCPQRAGFHLTKARW